MPVGGRETVPQMRFKRVPCADPDVTVFGISGSLGPRARPYLARLTEECQQRALKRVVLDLSEVDSLGGGTAQLLNDFASERDASGLQTSFVVTSPIVRSFLCRDPNVQPALFKSVDEALAAFHSTATEVASPASAASTTGTAITTGTATTVGTADTATPHFVEDANWDATLAKIPAREAPDEEKVRAAIIRSLDEHKLASRAHVLSLQADGNYHPVTQSGVDLERGIPADGKLVAGVLAYDGPALLFDLCSEALSEGEADLVGMLNCEVAAAFERPGAPNMLVFLSKEPPGEEYTLDEVHEIDRVLRGVSTDMPTPSSDGIPKPGITVTMDEAVDMADLLVAEEVASDPALRVEKPRAMAPRTAAPRAAAPRAAAPRAASQTEEHTEIRRKAAKLREILQLGRGFDATFGSGRILDVLVLSLISLTRSQCVLYFSERSNEFHLTHHRGLDAQAIPEMRLRPDSSLVQAVGECETAVRIAASNRITDEEKIWARQHGFQFVVPFRSKELVRGLILLGGAEPVDADLEMLTYLLHEAALAYDRANLYETLEDRTLGVVQGLMTLLESRSAFDAGSTESVVRYTQALAREIQYPQAHMRDLVYGTVLRDIGMLRIEQSVLGQTGQLSADEWEDVRRHTIEGAAILRKMRFSQVAVDVVMHHHEAYNGEGYPMKLRGRAIPLGARIVAIAESYVKMTMDRPYRKALGRVEALESLAENWGLRYDPLIVDALVRVVNRELSMGLESDGDLTSSLFGV